MNKVRWDRTPLHYLIAVTGVSMALIILNFLLGRRIPFTVHFLIGFVGSLLVFMVWHAWLTLGWKRSLLMFGSSFAIALSAEALGVNYGLIFGGYHYTGFLGLRLFGVPILTALAWEPVLYASFWLTALLSPSSGALSGSGSAGLRSYAWPALIGAFAATAWDIVIDPVAVSQGWWVWHEGGLYVADLKNGVPIQNFFGWLGVAFIILLLYHVIAGPAARIRHSRSLSIHGPLALYSALVLTSCGVAVTLLPRPQVAVSGMVAMAPILVVALYNVRRMQPGRESRPETEGPQPGVRKRLRRIQE